MDARPFKRAVWGHLAEVGKALSSNTRLEILDLLAQGPRTVDALASGVGQSVANTSHHLQALKRSRLVVGERSGQHVVYRLAGDDVGALLAQLQRVGAAHVAELERASRTFFASRDGLEAIDRKTLEARLEAGDAVLLDVRPADEFEAGHLPGAVSVPLSELDDHLHALPTDRTLVAYCRGPYCTFAADAARRLRERGFDAVRAEVSVIDPVLAR